MKHYIIILAMIFCASINLQAQKSEYMYLAIKLGVSNAFSGQPDLNPEKYAYTVGMEGESAPQMRIKPSDSFLGYVPGVNASLLFHFDFVGDAAGIFSGIDYNFTGISSKYETLTSNFSIIETHRMHMIGVPLAFKYGSDIWDTQRYIYLGAQINYIASIYTNEKASWGANQGRKLDPAEFNKATFSLFAGFNWRIVNLQIDFYPKSIFNEGYELVTTYKFPSTPKKTVVLHPNQGQVKNYFKVTLAVNVPYGWLSEKNFKIRRMLLKFPWK